MLKQRVLTAIIMLVVGLAALFGLPPTGFAVAALGLLVALGGWEAAQLAGVQRPLARFAFAAMLCSLGGLSLAVNHQPTQWATPAIFVPGCLIWIGFVGWLSRPGWRQENTFGNALFKLFTLAIMLLSAWLAMTWLQAQSPWLVILLLVTIASADVGAYFTGRAIGGPKLAPTISPGKTRAGAIGGLMAAATLTSLAAYLIPDAPFSPALALPVAVGLALLSIGGDLFISLLKRQRQLKDTAGFFPGHGGVLDRFDSLAAALPVFALIVSLLNGH